MMGRREKEGGKVVGARTKGRQKVKKKNSQKGTRTKGPGREKTRNPTICATDRPGIVRERERTFLRAKGAKRKKNRYIYITQKSATTKTAVGTNDITFFVLSFRVDDDNIRKVDAGGGARAGGRWWGRVKGYDEGRMGMGKK
jgi:hypothetical protein